MRTGHPARKFLCSALPGLLLAAQLVPPAQAAQVAIATAPLYITTTSLVKPNVLFIFDDSTSMDYNYLPDDVPWNVTSLGNPNPQTDTHAVALTSSQCNGVAYNPTIVYTPPVNARRHAPDADTPSSTRPRATGSTRFPRRRTWMELEP